MKIFSLFSLIFLTAMAAWLIPLSSFCETTNEEVFTMLTKSEKKELLSIARESLAYYLQNGKIKDFSVSNEKLKRKQGAFVTLENHGELRGCIGYIVGVKPLYETVAEMAVNAGTRDTRFYPVKAKELTEISFEISVLTPFEKIDSPEQVVVGKHGLYIKKGFYSGLLLPQVATEYKWDKYEFLKHVCQKAGLPDDAWKTGSELYVFSADVFNEEDENKEGKEAKGEKE
jgi:uncharacterized protein